MTALACLQPMAHPCPPLAPPGPGRRCSPFTLGQLRATESGRGPYRAGGGELLGPAEMRPGPRPAPPRRSRAGPPLPGDKRPQVNRAGILGSGPGGKPVLQPGGLTSLSDPPGGSSPGAERVGTQPKWNGVRLVTPSAPSPSTFLPGKIPLPLAKQGPEGVPAEPPGRGRTYLSAGY